MNPLSTWVICVTLICSKEKNTHTFTHVLYNFISQIYKSLYINILIRTQVDLDLLEICYTEKMQKSTC